MRMGVGRGFRDGRGLYMKTSRVLEGMAHDLANVRVRSQWGMDGLPSGRTLDVLLVTDLELGMLVTMLEKEATELVKVGE